MDHHHHHRHHNRRRRDFRRQLRQTWSRLYVPARQLFAGRQRRGAQSNGNPSFQERLDN